MPQVSVRPTPSLPPHTQVNTIRVSESDGALIGYIVLGAVAVAAAAYGGYYYYTTYYAAGKKATCNCVCGADCGCGADCKCARRSA